MKFALGTVQFGMDYGIQGGTKVSQEMVNEILALAMENKIDHFDTAASYGTAERALGHYIEKSLVSKNRMRIISKLQSNAFTEKPQIFWKDIVLRNISKSLKNLNVSELEAFLFHKAEYIFDDRAVQVLDYARKEGFARKIGVSIYTPEEALKAVEYDEIKVIQIPYNVFDQRLNKCGFFDKAKAKDIEVYARSSLLQGLLMMSPASLPKKMRFAERYLTRFLSICREYHISPLKAAIGYVGGHPDIDYIVFGVDNKVHLSEYLSMQDVKISEEMIKTFQKEFEDVEEKLVNPILWNSGTDS